MNSLAVLPRPESTQLASLTIRLLGDFAVTYDGKPIPLLNTPRLQALLTYLLLHRQASQSRRHLAFLFWPDSTEAQALTNLRKQLLYLRQVLPDCDALLAIDRHQIQWTSGAAVTLDVETFRAALAAAAQVADSQAIAVLRTAVTCYRGELLPGCYDEWIFAEREALHTQYGQALERLSSLLETQRNYIEAITYSEQLLRHDPLHEPTYRRLIRLHALNGDRPAALRIYHTCLTQLREELGVDPDTETQGVYERLLHGASLATTQPELAAYAPFVSRQAEWQTLQQRWRIALNGQPQFVLIAGEAGIGKTRLAEELLSWAIHQGFCTARARCYSAEGRLTYAPVIEWLRTERLRAVRTKIEPTWLTELARLLPEILQEQPTVRPPEPITQSWQRHHLFEAISRALLAIDQPLILLIDDLQWCDKETLELLHFLLRHAAAHDQSHLLLVGTARLPDEVAVTHPLHELLNPLRGSDTLTQLDLARLTQTETAALAHQMVNQPLDDLTVQQLFRDTAGNPLFVVETLRATQGNITRIGSTILSIDESEMIIQHLPPKVLAVIQARLGQLSAVARELCAWAAIVGRAFRLDLLVAASQIPQEKAVNALDELWQRRIIREQDNDAYDFSHDRIRDVAAAGVSRVRRVYLHQCVAEALENQSIKHLDNISATIAAHYEAAGMVEKAIHYFTQAAHRAAQLYTTDEAAAYLQRAIMLLKTLPESKTRDEHEFNLLVTLGSSLAEVSNFAVTLMDNVYARAYQLSQQLEVTLRPSMLRIFAIHRTSRRRFVEAQEIGYQLLALAEQQSTVDAKVVYLEGCYVIGATAFWQGHFAQARAYLQKVVDSFERVRQKHHLIEYGQDTGIYCRTRLGWTLWFLGFPDQARQQCEIALIHANQLQHPYTLFLAHSISAYCACCYRDVHAAERLVRVLDQIDWFRFTQKGNNVGFVNGWILLLRKDIDESIRQLVEYIDIQRSTQPDIYFYPQLVTLLADAYIQAKDYEHAFALLVEAFDTVESSQEYWYTAEMYRLKGELLMIQGEDFINAEDNLFQALTVSRRQESKSLELRAAISLGRLWAQQGKHKEAHALLAKVYNWFTEGFDTPDLQEAKALLAVWQK